MQHRGLAVAHLVYANSSEAPGADAGTARADVSTRLDVCAVGAHLPETEHVQAHSPRQDVQKHGNA